MPNPLAAYSVGRSKIKRHVILSFLSYLSAELLKLRSLKCPRAGPQLASLTTGGHLMSKRALKVHISGIQLLQYRDIKPNESIARHYDRSATRGLAVNRSNRSETLDAKYQVPLIFMNHPCRRRLCRPAWVPSE